MQLSVKEVDEKVFREFKAEAVREGFNVGKALTLAMMLWIHRTGKKPRMNILNLKPKDWGKGTERLSEEADEALYG